MSEQVNVSVNIDPDEIKAWAENHINGIPASVAHVLFAAHDLYAGMQEEWGVEDVFGDIVWFIPGDYVAAANPRPASPEHVAGYLTALDTVEQWLEESLGETN